MPAPRSPTAAEMAGVAVVTARMQCVAKLSRKNAYNDTTLRLTLHRTCATHAYAKVDGFELCGLRALN